MERENAWKSYSDKDLDKLEKLSSDYIEFISENKTERECVNASIAMAEKAGYKPLAKAIKKQRKLKAGDKVYAQTHGKALILAVLGTDPLEDGFNILGAHIDSPRLDAKQNPLYENTDIALLDTHYYGGIKKYQWVTLPLAIHGVIAPRLAGPSRFAWARIRPTPCSASRTCFPIWARSRWRRTPRRSSTPKIST